MVINAKYASTCASKKRFDALRNRYEVAYKKVQDVEIAQACKYGDIRTARSWASGGEKVQLEKVYRARDKIGRAIVELIVKVSPRGEKWLSGCPTHYLYRKLPWEDVVRPTHEHLSALPPPAWGMSEADVARHFAPAAIEPQGDDHENDHD